MNKNIKKNPTVMLLLDRARRPSRGMLKGFFRYAELNGPWHFMGLPQLYLKPVNIMETLRKFRSEIDGVLTYIPYNMNSKQLGLNKLPCVAIPAP